MYQVISEFLGYEKRDSCDRLEGDFGESKVNIYGRVKVTKISENLSRQNHTLDVLKH